MQMTPTALPGVFVLDVTRFEDDRGAFREVFHDDWMPELAPRHRPVRSAISHNLRRGTVRGMHLQRPPHAEFKLVQVTRGAVLDVVLDLRPGATWGRHVAVELNAQNGRVLWIPEGCAHGFCTLDDATDVLYQLSEDYAPAHQAGVRWDDPALGIDWPVRADEATLSDRDRALPTLAEFKRLYLD